MMKSTTRWTYGATKSVTSVERSAGGELWEYEYDDAKQQVTVTEPEGSEMAYDSVRGSDGLTSWFLSVRRARPPGKPSVLPPKPASPWIIVLTVFW